MSYFGSQLDELLKRKNMKAVELARLSGVTESMISRYRKGDYVALSLEDLDKISRNISRDPREQAQLIRAHLQDQCPPDREDLVRIEIAGESPGFSEPPVAYRIPLPPDLELAMDRIREALHQDADVRDIILGLGRLLEGGPKPEKPISSEQAQKVAEKVKGFLPSRKKTSDPKSSQ